ncbi:SIR2 family protein [uncultured Draconibacterium sp.]|uniref:SIR2 family protein n=1 Tax=uncultured Draconibacterium sp. TaxID=1573823 RepID=UPI0029C80CA8|nr:SIR2 family protein [uncultured Draconibacterium sp.]
MKEFKEDLIKHFQQFNTAPFLFIGSGFSRRYINLETWSDLIATIIEEISNAKPYEYYQSKTGSNNAQIASLVAEELHERWWTEKRFEESRAEFKSEAAKSEQAPLKYEISKYIKTKSVTEQTEYLEEINALKKVNVDGIITTNWDDFLESTFPDFTKYIGQSELLFSDSLNIGEIYKIHGCISDPNSLIVTTEDYRAFETKNPYLAAKLLTIFVEHPIIFLGYSLHDSNVIDILTSIVKCLNNENIDKLKNRLVFVKRIKDNSEPRISDSSLLLTEKRIPIPIKEIKLHSFTPLYEVLGSLKKRLPVKILRRMKGMVYEFVKTNEPTEKILVGENISNSEDADNIEYYFGVGIKSQLSMYGYNGIGTIELMEDLVFDDKNLNAGAVIQSVIPKALKGGKYFPVYKYLRKADYLKKDGKLRKTVDVSTKLRNFIDGCSSERFYPSSNYLKKKGTIQKNHTSIKSIQRNFDLTHTIYYIPFLKPEYIDISDLKSFLINNWSDELVKNTSFRKLICLYDYLKFGLQVQNEEA